MSEIQDKIKQIIVDELGVDDAEVTENARFIEDLGADSLDRITSYNVCYTKLLRGLFDHVTRNCGIVIDRIGVITSYSIHYTKLYEFLFIRRTMKGTGPF